MENLFLLDKKTRNEYLGQVNLTYDDLRSLKHKDKDEIIKQVLYTTYKPNKYGKFCNSFCENLTLYLKKTYPEIFKPLKENIIKSDLRILSSTYVSIMLFTSFLFSIFVLVGTIVVSAILKINIINSVINTIVFAFFAFILMCVGFYFYPGSLAKTKDRKIKNDLPFVIIHMSAIAGSGAHPMAMFQLVLKSNEYKGLHSEIKKIVNYVNLFGYDLSTALKAVSRTTASARFKELMNGIVANTQSGGDLKIYLHEKGLDALNQYRMEREKYVKNIETFSDIYTAVLIAAPLLFIVTLAIINIMGGKIAGLSLSTISNVGTFLVIPVLNVAFYAFITALDPGR